MKTYNGNDKYIFVSYAHKDSDTVLPIISEMQKSGFRIWFDEGIEAGTEWPEYIAEHLANATFSYLEKALHRKAFFKKVNAVSVP